MKKKNPKILIIGAGTLGFAIAMVLLRKGFAVTVWDVDKKMITRWCKLGYCPRYRWMRSYGRPKGLKLLVTDRINCSGYDFVVLATSMSGLEPVLKLIDNLDEQKTTLVTVQKGLGEEWAAPHHLTHRYFPEAQRLHFSGAGIGKSIAANEFTRMIVACCGEYWDTAERFLDLFDRTNIWRHLSEDPTGMVYVGVLRTITQGQLEIVRHMFRGQGNTLAAIESGITSEFWCILEILRSDANALIYGSPEWMAADADLCLKGTRSSKIGKLLAQGESVEEALRIAGHDGTIEAFENVRRIYEELRINLGVAEIAKNYPFLDNYYHLLWHGRTLDECKESILARQSSGSEQAV